MRFNFIISRWANFYFFVQNLSEWHFSNRKGYNIFWRKRLGVFSQEEENAIKEFKKIRTKYPDTKSFFEKSFFLLEDEPFKKLKENIFSLLQNKFEVLYRRELDLLEKWKKKLDKVANNKGDINTILDFLNILYKTAINQKKIDVYLLFSTPTGLGGGANIDDQSISLEISNYPIQKIRDPLGIIWHEIIHLVFQGKYFHPLLRKFFKDNRQKFAPINEIITASLFPGGVLGKRLFGNNLISIRLFYGLDTDSINGVLNLTDEYLRNRDHFDEKYIRKINLLFSKSRNRKGPTK